MESFQRSAQSQPSEYRKYYHEELKKLKGKRVLDVGRSNEWDYSGLFEDYTCYEINEGNDILNNRLPDNEFDLALCVGMYENVDDPIKMISEVRRVLKPRGKALFGFTGLDYETGGKRYDGHKLDGFKIIKEKNFDKKYHFFLCKKL